MMKDSEKKEWLIVRLILLAIFIVYIAFTYFVKSDDPTVLYSAVHPFHPLWDTIGLVCSIGLFLFLSGLIKPIYNRLQGGEGTTGPAPWIAFALGLGMLCYYI